MTDVSIMVWDRVRSFIGPGLHWSKSRGHYLKAIDNAEQSGDTQAADHIRIILELRDKVNFIVDEEKDPRD